MTEEEFADFGRQLDDLEQRVETAVEMTPEALAAWERSMAEIERRSRACTDAAAGNWGAAARGGRPVPPGEEIVASPLDIP